MSRMQVASFNDVKIYNLTAGKAIPQWLSEKERKKLAKNEDYRRRIEILQDFDFPTASNRVKMTPDNQYVVVTGSYPPSVKVYEVSELSLKFERRFNADVVDFICLAENFGKLGFLLADRTISLHAPYGAHHSLRIPKFGRRMVYHNTSCDLLVCGITNEIYRLNLDEGTFKAPFETDSEQVLSMDINPVHNLIACGGNDGVVTFFDHRMKTQKKRPSVLLDINLGLTKYNIENGYILDNIGVNGEPADVEVTSLKYDIDGLTLGVGTSSGHCLLYDLRSKTPLLVKEHQYGLPIKNIDFHNGGGATSNGNSSTRKIISTDEKIAKIWYRDEQHFVEDQQQALPMSSSSSSSSFSTKNASSSTSSLGSSYGNDESSSSHQAFSMSMHNNNNKIKRGAIMTNIEPGVDIKDVCIVKANGSGRDSGLMFMAGEQERVMAFYVPALGPAPEWCSFLDNVTEELEETEHSSSTVYDDYKFVARDEIETLGASSLVGTPLLRAFMHGYFMNSELYNKMKALAQPEVYEDWRKKKREEKLEQKKASRIGIKRKLPKVNPALAAKLLTKEDEKQESLDRKTGSNTERDPSFSSSSTSFSSIQQNPTGDDRFARLFTDQDFHIDESSETFKLRNPSGMVIEKAATKKKRKGAFDTDSEGEEEDDDDSENEDNLLYDHHSKQRYNNKETIYGGGIFENVDSEDEDGDDYDKDENDTYGFSDDESDSGNENEMGYRHEEALKRKQKLEKKIIAIEKKKKKKLSPNSSSAKKKPRFLEIKDGQEEQKLAFGNDQGEKSLIGDAMKRHQERMKPIGARMGISFVKELNSNKNMDRMGTGGKKGSSYSNSNNNISRGKVIMNAKEGTPGMGYREFSFIPKEKDTKNKRKSTSKRNNGYDY